MAACSHFEASLLDETQWMRAVMLSKPAYYFSML